MSNVQYNLILAEYACKYVETIMSKGPGSYNQDFSLVHRLKLDIPRRPIEPEDAGLFAKAQNQIKLKMYKSDWEDHVKLKVKDLAALTKEAREAQAEELAAALPTQNTPADAIRIGAQIEKSGLGNCGEQSFVAFKYLVTKRAPGLAIMNWGEASDTSIKADMSGGLLPSGNHMFVVIGMEATVPKQTFGSLDKPPDWGLSAVICDPWYHEWFAVAGNDTLWRQKMQQIFSATNNFKPDDFLKAKTRLIPNQTSRVINKIAVTQWRFERQVFLGYPETDHVRSACSTHSGEKLKSIELGKMATLQKYSRATGISLRDLVNT